MIKHPHKLLALSVAFAGMLLSFTAAQAQTLIYADTFTRTGALTGSAPDTASGVLGGTSGATWAASADWTTSGTVASTNNSGAANAYLPFTPSIGQTYTLSMNMSSNTPGNQSQWLALGFLINPTAAGSLDGSNGFQSNPPNPAFWLLLRGTGGISTFGGPSTGASGLNLADGTGTQGGLYSITMQQTSAGNYTYIFAGPGIPTNSNTLNLGSNTIAGVGFGMPGGGTSDTSDNFRLTAAVPEPSTYAIGGLGVLGLVVLRARSRQRAQA